MAQKRKQNKLTHFVSDCCGAEVHAEGLPDFDDGKVHTWHYECNKCNQPCNPVNKPAKKVYKESKKGLQRKYWGNTPRSGQALSQDIMRETELPPTTKEEHDYYMNLRDVGIACQHQFFEISKLVKDYNTLEKGVLVRCALCGEKRQLWEHGKLLIINSTTNEWEEIQ